ncbi:MAG: DNA ligase D [Elusimicrobia bacterium]|nr:DNA ligase D [Candidatus Liberimonas magnetica]
MILKEYRKKRNFAKTPEPPALVRKTEGFRFVVHKHRATRLHYDLRLEHHGVLKSWAVPKGITNNPGEKHLAILVEDHPFEYKDFEGRIPKGNYGAGEVIIWDEGTYTPVGTNMPSSRPAMERRLARALSKGHVSIRLEGKKLHGEFYLIRLKNRENQWLIIKKADEYAKAQTLSDTSARSGKTLEDIANEKPEPQYKPAGLKVTGIDFKGALKSPMPAFVEPMLATLSDAPFDRGGWAFEVKWDGYRCIARIDNEKVTLYSRNAKVYNDTFPAIAEAFKGARFNAIFDGEVVAVDREGRSDFGMLQDYIKNQKGTIIYYVFDCLYLGSYDLRALPLVRRKEILSKILPVSGTVRLSGHVETKGTGFYHAAEQNGLEGIIAKKLDSPYLAGARSRDWLKIKTQKRQEAVICGFTEGRSSRKYFGALVLGVYKDGKLKFAGHAGGGFDEEGLKEMYAKLKPLITKLCPFEHKPKTNMPVTWVKPELIVEVKFREWTKDGMMRQPIVLGLRDDKDPSRVVLEENEGLSTKKQFIDTKVVLTNLDKVFWPKEGLTKKDVIEYYWRLADIILPYLKGRPQSLNRHPNGITGKNFFQKDMERLAPEWAETMKVSEGGDITYLLCQERDTLIFLANLGCIEINVWNSVAGKLDKPDYVVLDFDPVEVPFSEVVEAVLATKEVLDQIGAPGFCKTSGSKGMHIYIPILPVYGFDQAKNFAHLINMVVKRRLPKTVSLERVPEKRKGLVYLDYLQNTFGATMAAPYSLRPREGAPVSTPLGWDEVNTKLNPLEFNIHTVPGRIGKKGDPWKGMFKQMLDLSKTLDKLQKLLG